MNRLAIPKARMIQRILGASLAMPDVLKHENYLWTLSEEQLAERMQTLEMQSCSSRPAKEVLCQIS
jgi:hypothetical protein